MVHLMNLTVQEKSIIQAFLVAKMDNLSIIGDTIKFTLHVQNNEIFTKAINLKITSSDEARKKRYKNWMFI